VAVKIDKVKREAELTLSDGSRLKGSFFLYAQSPLREEGGELVFDVLNGEKRFIPMEAPGGDMVLIQKDCVVTAKLAEKEWVADETYVKVIRVRVSLLSEAALDGKIFVDLPEERSRLSDFFNLHKGFFYLNVDGAQHLVNFRFVKTVKHSKAG
jgi:hypothetical protein